MSRPRPLSFSLSTLALVLVFGLTLPFVSGCSLLGLGIGSQIPHYQRISQVTRGDAVYLELDDGDVVHGPAVAVGAKTITVYVDAKHDRVVPVQRVKTMSRRRGSEWLSTFIIGLVVDSVAAGFIALGLAARH